MTADALNNPDYDPCMFACMTAHDYEPSYHHAFLSRIVADRINRGGARIIINIPPRYGKSRLFAIETPLWFMSKKPGTAVVCASYALDLPLVHSRQAKSRFETEYFIECFPEFKLSSAVCSADYWQTNTGCSYKAVGVGGALTGHGADLLILDDLHKDSAEASSETHRNRVWEWLQSTALTRLSPYASAILIGTRWHQDDVTGRLLQQQPGVWEVINLPVFAEDYDPLQRNPGEVLWPTRFSADEVQKIQRGCSKYFWAALYCGKPVAAGGNYIEIDRFKICDESMISSTARRARYWDLAASEKQTADYTAGALCAYDRESDQFWIIDITRGQWEWPRARAHIQLRASIDRCQVGVEAVSGFKTAFQNLIEDWPHNGGHVSDYPAEKDKLTRALPWFTHTNLGKVNLVRAAWNSDFLTECSEFPMGDHDDQVDAVSGAFNLLTTATPIMPHAFQRGNIRSIQRRTREVTC